MKKIPPFRKVVPALFLLWINWYATTAQDRDVEWRTLNDPGYQLRYPESWELDQSGMNQTKFILFGRTPADMRFRENINLIVQDLTVLDYSLNDYVEISLEQLESFVVDLKMSYSRRVLDHGVEYHELVYQGEFAPYELKWKQRYWVREKKAYVLTYTAPQETFDEFLGVVDKIFDSFSPSAN